MQISAFLNGKDVISTPTVEMEAMNATVVKCINLYCIANSHSEKCLENFLANCIGTTCDDGRCIPSTQLCNGKIVMPLQQ